MGNWMEKFIKDVDSCSSGEGRLSRVRGLGVSERGLEVATSPMSVSSRIEVHDYTVTDKEFRESWSELMGEGGESVKEDGDTVCYHGQWMTLEEYLVIKSKEDADTNFLYPEDNEVE
jgi:hypothetical protein